MKNSFSRAPLSVVLLTLSLCASVFSQTLVFQGRVVNVADGDTVTVLTASNTEFQVRCRGINAPKGQQDFASQSRQRLTGLLLDEPVTVRYGQRELDGTISGAILWNGRDVCLEQVTTGMAWYDDQSEQRRSTHQQFARAEAGARNNHAGLWSTGVQRDTSGPPISASDAPRSAISPEATVSVRGYFRKDGTYVAGYRRTAPDNNFSNNFSSQGNVNPFTGKVGTKRQSRWITALKWVGIGAALAALIYVDAKYVTPTSTPIPTGPAMARCNDGTYSYSQNRRGTCSHHGGVAVWLR
jgi:endonuclease YncB( thermonuclease family)